MDKHEIQQKAHDILLRNSDIDEAAIRQSLELLQERHIDFGDLFFERVSSESFVLEEGIIKGGSFDISQGVGVRAILGGKTGFSYSDVLDKASLKEACLAARSISTKNAISRKIAITPYAVEPLYSADDPLLSMSREHKIKLLEAIDEMVRAEDKRVTQVIASLNSSYRVILVARTDGQLAYDIKPVVSVAANVTLEHNGKRESGFGSAGGAFMLDRIANESTIKSIAHEAVRVASLNLDAAAAPAGTMSVVLGAGWPGVLIHEAVGHGLEGDFNRTGSSNFTGLIGQKVASAACTIVDNGTMPERRGSSSIDDEGTPSKSNILIENGILKGYMQDRQNAMLMKQELTGNGRRESYNCLPMPRMTNTYMMPGNFERQEIIESVKDGIYAVNFKGGQVDITSGKFVFSTSEAYRIRDGKIAEPIKGATLIGNGPETMQQVSMVGNDLEFDRGIGVCGKGGQSVPVGIGTPTLKVDAITVGGTEA